MAAGLVKKWALIVDVAKCTNCQNCVLATQDEHSAAAADWIRIERRTRGNNSMVDVTYVPQMCNHCDDAPCVRAAGNAAIHQRPDGIVVIDPVKSHKRRDLLDACPYGVISWNEQAELPQKWSFDAHLLDRGWMRPRCEQACPTGAMQSMRLTDDELQKLRAAEGLEELRPDLHTRPRVLYRNLRRTNRLFLGGTVIRRLAGGMLENVAQARVELAVVGEPPLTCLTDAFGDFKFDDLAPSASAWSVQILHPEHGHARATGLLSDSCYLGTLELATS